MAKIFTEVKKQLNKDIKNKFDELEEEKARFIEAACIFCVDWIRGYVERKAFQYDLQITEKLGLKLKEFKHEVDDFCQEVPELVREELSKKSYWQHYEISDVSNIDPKEFRAPYHFNSVSEPQILDRGIRLSFGKFGIILDKYGYLNPKKYSTDQWKHQSGVLYYPFPLIRYWPRNLAVIAESYAKKLEEFQELNFKLSQTIEEEKKSEIKMDWH